VVPINKDEDMIVSAHDAFLEKPLSGTINVKRFENTKTLLKSCVFLIIRVVFIFLNFIFVYY
jgi:hypothetical protein